MSEADLVELDVNFLYAGQPIQVTFGFEQIGPTSGDQRADLANDFDSHLGTPMRNCISNTYAATSYVMRDVVPGTLAQMEINLTGVTGARSGAPVPSQVASVITWRTPIKGRSFRGRSYMPGALAADVTSDLFGATYLGLLE